MDKEILKSINKIIKYKAKMHDEQIKLANIANDLFKRSAIGDILENKITCEINEVDGVVFVIETEGDMFPHVIRVSEFLDLFVEEKLSLITHKDLLSISF